MSSGVVYFNVGTKHLVRLVVSIASLRKVYSGPVYILNGGGDDGAMYEIAGDRILSVEVRSIPFVKRKRNSAYVAKASLWRHSPFEKTLYLDADTVVAKDPSDIFDLLRDMPLVVTRFSNWRTNRGLYVGRIWQWLDVRHPHHDISAMAKHCLEMPFPAINTGVVGWRKDCRDLAAWEAITQAGADQCKLTDELAMQLLATGLYDLALLDDRWNASPIYRHCRPEDVAIWHPHGNKHLRPEAAPIWLPHYRTVWNQDLGGIRRWSQEIKTSELAAPLAG